MLFRSKFSEQGYEIPIVFVLKNRVGKIGKFQGQTVKFSCKNNKVKDNKSTLEELKSRYKRAVLDGKQAEADELFKMIDALSGGKAKEVLRSFFDYTKYYKKIKKQLIIDLFAHFFMLYIYSMISAAKGGVVRKNKIFKPFKSGEIEMVSAPKQDDGNNLVLEQKEILRPTDFGIHNIKSITIEQNVSSVEDSVKVKVSDGGNNHESIVPNVQQPIIEKQQPSFVEGKPKQEIKKPKSFTEQIMDMLSFEEMGSDSKRYAIDESFNYSTSNFLQEDESFYQNNQKIGLDPQRYSESDFFGELSSEQFESMQNQFGSKGFEEIEHLSETDVNENFEEKRESVLKKKKRVIIKKYGSEFNGSTKETKSLEDQNVQEKMYDFEG